MINKKKISSIILEYLEGTDKFLVEVKITPQNKVMVFIDGDSGVSISDCAVISKHIEDFFDRDKEDFELEVSSAGIGKPLLVLRQYLKNIGRKIAVSTVNNEKIVGELKTADEKGITIEPKDQKSSNKKKDKDNKADKIKFLSFNEIKEAKIKPVF